MNAQGRVELVAPPAATSRPLATWCCLLAGCLLTGCGGTDEGRSTQKPETTFLPDPGSKPVLCDQSEGYEIPPEGLIDDFETGAAIGAWYTNNDVCEGCQELRNQISELPATGAEEARAALLDDLDVCLEPCIEAQPTPIWITRPIPADAIPNGRCGSRFAMHVQGGPFAVWGGTFGLNLNNRDVSSFDGVAFWARKGPSGRNTLRIDLGDLNTDDQYVDSETGRSRCLPGCPNVPPGVQRLPGEDCFTEDNQELGCDKFGAYALLGADWKYYRIPFSEFRQSGYGLSVPSLCLRSSTNPESHCYGAGGIRSLSTFYGHGQWDIWFDDIGFYRQER